MDARPAPENGDTAVKRIEESGSLLLWTSSVCFRGGGDQKQ